MKQKLFIILMLLLIGVSIHTMAIAVNDEEYKTKMDIDEPSVVNITGTTLEIRGWIMSTSPDVKIQIKIDNTEIKEITRNEERPDVLSAIKGYGDETINPIPGFKDTIDISNVTDGSHSLTFQVLNGENDQILDSRTKNISIQKYKTKMDIDEPSTDNIKGTSLQIRGWAMSTAPNVKIQIKIDNTVVKEITRNEKRTDVLSAIKGYGDSSTNSIPGFKDTIDISNVTDGSHNLNFQVVNGTTNEVMSTKVKNITIRKHETKMDIDEPSTDNIKGTSLQIRGWVMSTSPDVKIQIKIDNTVIKEMIRNEERSDVLSAIKGYGDSSINSIPGFKDTIDISNVTDGNHSLTFQVVNGESDQLLDSRTKNISIQKYKTKMDVDEPSTDNIKGTSLQIRGWVMSTLSNIKIQIKIDNTVIKEMTRNEERSDVLNAIKGYGDESLNSIPGFKDTIDISNVTDGSHSLIFQVVNGITNEVMSSKVKNITIKKYETKMYIDEPSTDNIKGTSLQIRGWAMSTSPDVKIQIKIDNTVIKEMIRNEERPDVLSAIKGYGDESSNPKPGFKDTIDISSVADGGHTLVIQVLEGKTREVIEEKATPFQLKKYDGTMYIDSPITSMFNNNITIEGWEMSELDGSYIKIYINNKEVKSDIKRVERPDVLSAIKNYGDITVNPTPGFTTEINLSSFTEGKQTLRVDLFTKLNEKIDSYSKTIFIYHDIYYGVDVSKWNGAIDWYNVKKQGIDFAITRVGYGREANQKDPTFETNYAGAKSVGIDVGTYLYSYAKDVEGAKLEAYNCLAWLNGRKLDYPVFYDLEDDSQLGLDKQTITDMAKAFCEIIHNAGYKTGVYANKYWLQSKIDTAQLPDYCDIWLAHYTGTSDPVNNPSDYKGEYQMWQYTSTGSVSGISGNVDMNLCYKKY